MFAFQGVAEGYKKEHVDPTLHMVTHPGETVRLYWKQVRENPGDAILDVGFGILAGLLTKKVATKLPAGAQKIIDPPGPGAMLERMLGNLRTKYSWFAKLDDLARIEGTQDWDLEALENTHRRPSLKHFIADHVNISDADLRAKAARSGWYESKFSNPDRVADLLQRAIADRADEISRYYASNPADTSPKRFTVEFNELVGYGYHGSDSAIIYTKRIGVVVTMDSSGNLHIHSFFPIIEP